MYDVRTQGQTVLSLNQELTLQRSSGTGLEFLVLVNQFSIPPVLILKRLLVPTRSPSLARKIILLLASSPLTG